MNKIKHITTHCTSVTDLPLGTYRGVHCSYTFTIPAPNSPGSVTANGFEAVVDGPALDIELDIGIKGTAQAEIEILPLGRCRINYLKD